MKAYTAARWNSGVPLWNPLSACGEPWLAQLQTGVFYPGDLPFLLRGAWGPLLGIALHLAIASSGMAAWLSSLGTSRAGALLGAGVYGGGGGFLSLALVYNNFETASFLPWLFLAARRAARGGSPAGFGAAFALAFLGGEPALAVLGAAAAALVAFATRGDEPGHGPRGVRSASRLAGGLVLGAGLAAVAAIPFLEYARTSGRLTGVTRNEALARPVGTSDLIDLVLPPSDSFLARPAEGRGGYLDDARALPARSPARGGRGRGPRGAAASPRRAGGPVSRGPPPRARSARRAALRVLGRRTRTRRAISRALVHLHASRPRGPRGCRPRRLAARAASGLAEGPCARGSRGRFAIRRSAPRARRSPWRGSRGASRRRRGLRPSDRPSRVDGASRDRSRCGDSRVRADRRAARSPPCGQAARRDRGSASSPRFGERVRIGAACAPALRRRRPGGRPGPGFPGGLGRVRCSRRSPAKPAESGAARRAHGRARRSRATRTCRSASPRRPRHRRSEIRG